MSRLPHAALGALIILQLTMLTSLYAGVMPHPPRAIPLFAMGPFLGLALSLATMALVVGPTGSLLGRGLSVLAALAALLSYGPQKWLDPAIGEIWPAVLLGQLAAFALIVLAARPSLALRA
ncbi:MAG: hypothetical protein KI785_08940 [Devosiaceae bacterium]|nr:hypothetical protein [Devosiaceae bacterium MH13]